MVGLAGVAFIAIFFFSVPFPVIIFGAAIIGVLAWLLDRGAPASSSAPVPSGRKGEPAIIDRMLDNELPERMRPSVASSLRVSALWLALWLVPVIALAAALGSDNVFSRIAVFFSKVAVVTFGGAYAVLAYAAQQAVDTYGWVSPDEMLDGLGMAETTPGPLIMVLQFVGFMAAYHHSGGLSPMLAGTLGGLLATWVTFTPCFLWIFLGAPFVETLRANKAVGAALAAVTAAVVGVILNLAVWFAVHNLFRNTTPVRAFPLSFVAPDVASVDAWALALSLAAAIAIFRFRVGMIPTLAACCAAGVVLFLLGAIA